MRGKGHWGTSKGKEEAKVTKDLHDGLPGESRIINLFMDFSIQAEPALSVSNMIWKLQSPAKVNNNIITATLLEKEGGKQVVNIIPGLTQQLAPVKYISPPLFLYI